MANAWNLTDVMLDDILTAYIGAVSADDPWLVDLFKNDYTPVPGMVNGDMTPADFDGYETQELDPSTFGTVGVVAHIATTTASDLLEFGPSEEASDTQTVYGYRVQKNDGTLIYAERFAAPVVVSPGGEVKITARLIHVNVP